MTAPATRHAATATTVGAALWTLVPVAFSAVDLENADRGTLSFVASVTAAWLCLAIAPLLLVAGLPPLRQAIAPEGGRFVATGAAVAGAGFAAMGLGNGIELASITAGGGTVAAGHAIFLVGYLVSIVGGVLLGIAVLRRCPDVLGRIAGTLLTLAFPIGLAIGFVGTSLNPDNDAWFFAAVTVPTGLAWLLLGRRPAGSRTGVPTATAA
ncbi:hypothetical protein [Geodermatophilus sp. URMC 64]